MNADKFVVRGQTYDVLSPATFGDYIETVGAACINPSGYPENKLFLAYDDNVQKLFRATAAIAYSELLIKNTNCEPTTMAEALANALSAGGVSYDNTDSGLTASNAQGAIDEVNGKVETVKSDLSNVEDIISQNGAYNLLPNNAKSQVVNGVTFSTNGKEITLSGSNTSGSAFQFQVLTSGESTYITNEYNGMKLVGTPEGGGTNSCLLVAQTNNNGTYTTFTDEGNGVVIGNAYPIKVYIRIGATANFATPMVVKPMITNDLDATYDDYVPYSKTNQRLTNDLSTAWDLASAAYIGVTDPNLTPRAEHHIQFHNVMQGNTYKGPNAYDQLLLVAGWGSTTALAVIVFNGVGNATIDFIQGGTAVASVGWSGNYPTITMGGYANGFLISARGFSYIKQ